MKSEMIDDFKKFIMRGNVIDMAVGVIVGGAFGKIVSSLVNDMLMPSLSLVMGKVNFKDLFISLNGQYYATLAEAQKAGAPTLNYGAFINAIVDFLIIAFTIFIVIKQLSRFEHRKAEAAPPPSTKECLHCFSVISIQAKRCPHCTSNL